ncbi:serine/threonine-protein phosphatase 7 long form homolog [Primulina eburnea]|uniref:serine/threonine-protein phosphatase 7 long form homolog n=1 Tax=Primulina eburnea TaxID=1245227 RepID=UPI003C6C2600
MGLYGVLRCGFRPIDNHLITALVERWRRETHTFHLRVGEATVTLQDVEIICGLNIKGQPVTGTGMSHTAEEWRKKCVELLGFAPTASLVTGGRLSISVLDTHCIENQIDNDSSDLELLLNILRASRYSWGSGVLSFLYRELCKSSIIGRKIICGPLLILQVWAWSMMTSLSPDVHGFCHIVPAAPDVNDNDYDTILPIAPYGARWARHFSHTHTSTHSVRIIREILYLMEDGQFNWTVYNFEALDVQAFITGHQGEIWRCVCPLICFDIVEMYRSNRWSD